MRRLELLKSAWKAKSLPVNLHTLKIFDHTFPQPRVERKYGPREKINEITTIKNLS
tara:strand:- start:4085 stop:4252 length:168 start_codon:yes stop_codon:yes gene_type:complete